MSSPALTSTLPRSRVRSSAAAGHVVVLLASCAAFAEQPLVGRLLLPDVGGSIVAWTTTVVFFQTSLIAGYLLAGLLERTASRWAVLLLLGVLAGPLVLTAPWLGEGPGTVVTRLVLVAPGYVALTAVPILMGLRDRIVNPGGNPYRLSATSNAGSLLGLALGLLATEVTLLANARIAWWAVTAVALVGAVWLLLGTSITRRPHLPEAVRQRVSAVARWRWLAFSALASAVLVSYTTWLGEQTVVMPLLWVMPLAIFLGLYAFAFAMRPARRPWPSVVAVGVAMLAALIGPVAPDVVVGILVSVPVFGVATWATLRRLESATPDGIHLAAFWIHVAIGGAIGGALATFAAPLLLPDTWEAPALLLLALALVPSAAASRRLRVALLAAGVGFLLLVAVVLVRVADGDGIGAAFSPEVMVVLVAAAAVTLTAAAFDRRAALVVALVAAVALPVAQLRDSSVIDRGRTFFGSWEVIDTGDGTRLLVSSGTIHGSQLAGRAGQASSYYGEATGIGQLVGLLREEPGWTDAKVTGIGMGAGTVAAWSEPGQQWTFLEIDPDVIDLARDYFTYLRDAPAEVDVVEGDGRIEAARLPARSQELLILDAYQGDSVPTHLLTREACELYDRTLVPGGAIAVHVSNHHLRLAPVVASCADAIGMTALMYTNAPVEPTADSAGSSASQWVVVTANDALLAAATASGWVPIPDRVVWTDEKTPLLGIVRFD